MASQPDIVNKISLPKHDLAKSHQTYPDPIDRTQVPVYDKTYFRCRQKIYDTGTTKIFILLIKHFPLVNIPILTDICISYESFLFKKFDKETTLESLVTPGHSSWVTDGCKC
jgi:hypothetical protein